MATAKKPAKAKAKPAPSKPANKRIDLSPPAPPRAPIYSDIPKDLEALLRRKPR